MISTVAINTSLDELNIDEQEKVRTLLRKNSLI